jgi:nitrate/nitrite-specific signal transduction histidine kinase
MGLHIMDYRARRIGGVLNINGNGSGTVVVCRVGARVGK